MLKEQCAEIIIEILSKNNHPHMTQLEHIIPNLSSFYGTDDIYDDKVNFFVNNAHVNDLNKILLLKPLPKPQVEPTIMKNPERHSQKVCGSEFREQMAQYYKKEQEKMKAKKDDYKKFEFSEPENQFNIF